jgi:polysaccharide export outer membrane protein
MLCFGALVCSASAGAQELRTRAVLDGDRRHPDASDLARQNATRVAASPAQVREILTKDPGLLVELKHWVAKEATDQGQIVEDRNLSDQAIFERLGDDIEFRSVATRLVQRYGYLLPVVNPDSETGKQQDLVLKERARRLVAIEAQEEQERLRPGPELASRRLDPDQTACDDETEEGCAAHPPSTRSGRKSKVHGDGDDGQDSVSPRRPEVPSPSLTMQASLTGANGALSSLSSAPADFGRSLGDISPPQRSGRNLWPFRGSGEDPDAAAIPYALPGPRLDDETTTESLPAEVSEKRLRESSASADSAEPASPLSRRGERSDIPVSMVRKANPYSDIPSLYDLYVQASSREGAPERFGLDFFRSAKRDRGSVPMDIPAGPDYVVGPGDGLAINVWGSIAQRISRTVDREGRIVLPEAGPLLVSGRTLGEVQFAVQQALRTQFRDASADVSLSRLRTIRVYVVGEVANPGAQEISSLSTPLNALAAAGGITSRGSLRTLKHYRGNRLVQEVDAYDLLLNGVRNDLERLENGDSLLVSPVARQVTVEGMVRRPAIYELRGESSLEDALELAGGVLPLAALEHVEVERLVANQKRTMTSLDLSSEAPTEAAAKLAAFQVRDGDRIHVFPIASFNENALYLQGHVLRPGRYSYKEAMRLGDLIHSYSDLLPEPAGGYAEIIRLNPPDFRPSVESFNLTAALANPAASPILRPLDTIRIFSRYDFEPAPTVWVGGEVRAPGTYRLSGRSRLSDAVYLASGLSSAASLDSAQLFRAQPNGLMQVLDVNLASALAGTPADNLLLEPHDRVLIQRNLAKVEPATVYIKGEVAKPGRYPLTQNMHVEDLIRIAGGLKRSADAQSGDLTTHPSGDRKPGEVETMKVSLDFASGRPNDTILSDGDVLTIRQMPGWRDLGAAITLRGEVERPGTYGIRPGETLSSVIERAGGFSAQAYPYGAVLMRPEVRELEIKSRDEMIARVKAEQVQLKALPENDQDQKNLKLNAIAQTETVLTQLQSNLPVGRVVIHIGSGRRAWRGTPADVAVRDGDVLLIPKKNNYVTVTGQVFHPTAVSFQPGRNAKWYLSQAGGMSQIADRKAVFVIRADGSVISAKNNSEWWQGDPLGTVLSPGDSIVVPEKAPKIGSRNWAILIQTAQAASAVALAVAYLAP